MTTPANSQTSAVGFRPQLKPQYAELRDGAIASVYLASNADGAIAQLKADYQAKIAALVEALELGAKILGDRKPSTEERAMLVHKFSAALALAQEAAK